MLTRRTFAGASAFALVAAVAGLRQAGAAGPSGKTFEIQKTPEEWRKVLTKEQFYILREHGTERAFTSPLDKIYSPGVYNCAGCDLPLYSSTTKFDSRTGWPSFHTPLENAVGTMDDYSWLGIHRTEVHCRRCGGHLGHVFKDGPPPTGERHCINGIALKFVPETADAKAEKNPT